MSGFTSRCRKMPWSKDGGLPKPQPEGSGMQAIRAASPSERAAMVASRCSPEDAVVSDRPGKLNR